MRLRWKIGLIGAAVLATIAAILVLLPHVIDVEAYKPGLITAVRDATGRELVIDGPMRLSVLPVPGIGAGKVHFSNAVGAKGAQMIDVRWVAITPSWWALLQGRFEVGTLTLYRPTIVLETDANGRPNWQFDPGGGTRQQQGAPSSGLHLAIGRLAIVRGKVTYTNPRDGSTLSAENVDGGATVRSFDGPFEIDGSATVNGIPLKLALAVGDAGADGHRTRLSLEVSSGKLAFDGSLTAVAPDATAQGRLSVETGRLSDFVNALWGALGGEKPRFDTTGAGRFSFAGNVVVSPRTVAANNFEIRAGKDEARGSLSLVFEPVPTLTGKVSLSHLDVDKWLMILSRPIDFAPATVKAAIAPRAKDKTSSPWSALDADVTVDVGEARYRRGIIRNLSLPLEIKKGVATLPRVSALLPGDMKLEADTATGRFSLSGGDLRQTLNWLDIDTSGIPEGRLRTLSVDGKVASMPGSLQVSDARFALDDTTGTAGGTLLLKSPFSAALHAEANQVDLEAYRPTVSPTPMPDPVAPAPSSQQGVKVSPADTPTIALKLKVGNLAFRGQMLKGVEGDVTVQGSHLQLAGVRIADVAGARLDLKGAVDDFGTAPHFDLSFNVAASDADRLLDYAGLPHFLNGRIGRATASGGVSGTFASVALRDVATNFLDTESRISGTLSFGDNVAYDFPAFFLHTRDASALVSAASGRAMSSVGYIRATGSLKGTSQQARFSGEIRARGSRMNGQIETTLDRHPRLVANLKVPGVLKIDRWLGIDPKSAAHIAPVEDASDPTPSPTTSQPINLTALRAFDVKLSMQADTMTLTSLTVEQAEIEAALTNGMVKVAKLAGAFYGGAASLAGTIDASGSALSVDLAGDVRGIALDRLLKGTLGRNTLASSGFSIAIEGKVDATDLRITGSGISSQEIRNALSGAATVSGFLHPVVVDGSPAFASFAASVGGIFSDGLAFDAQVLKSFIGRQNPLSGQVSLGAGGLTMENQTIRGASATARISGRASFADDMINSIVTLDSGADRYVTTVKGPLAAPDLNTTRNSLR
ncbi:AsmA family protein [Reyranella sp.]|uniref:AsmA family protein n=1 Tax=Reyranella sp. TaxID=1929291 RepID=UPI002F95FBFA